jgi:YD repeat-containing protein
MLDNIQLNSQSLIRGITYDGADRLANYIWGVGGVWRQGVNDANQIQSISNTNSSGNSNFGIGYGFDLDGRINSAQVNGTDNYSYSYDNNSQLIREINPRVVTNFQYDQNGNRINLYANGQILSNGTAIGCPFNPIAYADYYPSIKAAFGYNTAQLQQHWLTYGIRDGLDPCGAIVPGCKFVSANYVNMWADVKAAGLDGTTHYTTYGINEGRGICLVPSDKATATSIGYGYTSNHLTYCVKCR